MYRCFIILLALSACSVAETEVQNSVERPVSSAIQKVINDSINFAFEDGKFSVDPNTVAWFSRSGDMVWNNTYLQERFYLLFFSEDMTSLKYIMSCWRNGQYGPKKINNEIVSASRVTANLEVVDIATDPIHTFPSWPDLEPKPYTIPFEGTLYRVKVQNGYRFTTPNSTVTPNSQGTKGRWEYFQVDSWVPRLGSRDLSGSGSHDGEIQFGYSVYLYVENNKNGKSRRVSDIYRDPNSGLLLYNTNSVLVHPDFPAYPEFHLDKSTHILNNKGFM